MVKMDLTRLLTILLIRKGVLSEGEIEEERRRLINKFRVGNVFTSEELERIKKAIEDYIAAGKPSGWAEAMLLGSMRDILRRPAHIHAKFTALT
jgi:hypothetical protein